MPAVAALFALAAVARVAFVLATPHLALRDDAADYDRLARLVAHGTGFGSSVLAAGGGPTAFRPPLYPLFVGTLYRISGDSVTFARLVQAFIGAAAVAVLALLARRLWDDRVALVGAAIGAVYPPLVVASTALMSEAIFIPLELGALLCIVRHRDEAAGIRWAAVAGLLTGLAVLARPQGVVLALPLLLLAARGTGRSRARLGCVVVVSAMALTIAPSIARNAHATGHFVPVSDLDGFNFAGTYNADAAASASPYRYAFRPPTQVAALAPAFHDPTLDEVELSARMRHDGLRYAADHPGQVMATLAWNSARLFDLTGPRTAERSVFEQGFGRSVGDLYFASYVALAMLALVGACTRAARRVPLAFWTTPVLLWLVTIPVLGNSRLRSGIEPFVVLLAALAIATLVSRRDARSPR